MDENKVVFATSFNIKRTLLASKIDEGIFAGKIISDAILDQPLHIPESDLNALKALYIFLDNPEVFIKEYFKGWKDTYKYLIEEPPAYHYTNTCPFFLKDFYNVAIPQKVKDKNLVEEAKAWAYTNKNLLNKTQIQDFKQKFITHFNVNFQVGLTELDLSTIDRPNSGAEMVKNDIETIKEDIGKLLNKYYSSFSSEKRAFYEREFRKTRYNYNNEYAKSGNYTEHKIFNDLNEIMHYLVKPLVKSISDYIMLKLNKVNAYKPDVLESLNFRPCKGSLCGNSGDYILIATL